MDLIKTYENVYDENKDYMDSVNILSISRIVPECPESSRLVPPLLMGVPLNCSHPSLDTISCLGLCNSLEMSCGHLPYDVQLKYVEVTLT